MMAGHIDFFDIAFEKKLSAIRAIIRIKG